MSLGLRHLAWVRACFSGLCRATARLADGVAPLVPPPPCSPAFYLHLLCASPAQLVSSLPSPTPRPRGSCRTRLLTPGARCPLCRSLSRARCLRVLCSVFCPNHRSSVSSSPVLSERAGPAPQAGSRPRPASLCGWCPRSGARPASPQAFTRPPPPPQPSLACSFLCLRFLFPGHRALLEKCFVQVTEWFRCQFMSRSLTVPSFLPISLLFPHYLSFRFCTRRHLWPFPSCPVSREAPAAGPPLPCGSLAASGLLARCLLCRRAPGSARLGMNPTLSPIRGAVPRGRAQSPTSAHHPRVCSLQPLIAGLRFCPPSLALYSQHRP